jgi:hypothetical protein
LARAGIWERNLMQERGVALGTVFLDGTSIRAHRSRLGEERIVAVPPSLIRKPFVILIGHERDRSDRNCGEG